MSTELVVKSSTKLATKLGIEPGMMIETIKAMCFPTMRPENITDAQTAAFISVCATQDLNPLVAGQVYAYPTKSGGIVPVIGPDGVFKKLGERTDVSYECEVFPADVALKPTHAKATIYVEGKERPYTFTAVFSEWYVSNNPNWNTRPRHMIWLRALKQCARLVINGLPMDKEEATLAELINVTGTGDEPQPAPVERPPAKERSKRGVAAVAENPGKTDSQAADPKAGTIEVPVTPVVDPKPETATPGNPPAPVTPVEVVPQTEKPKADSKPAVTQPTDIQLEDGKEVTIPGLIVERFVTKEINKIPNSVDAVVSGSYKGQVYHLGGGGPAWQIEKPVTLRILGKKLKSGAIAGMVQSIELTAAPAADGETVE